MYQDQPLKAFFFDLASDQSSPGGGSVAALTGVQAVSLVLMVARLTIGKKNYADVQQRIEEIIKVAEPIKDLLMMKVDEDVKIFQEIMDTYELPKDQRELPLKEALTKSAFFSYSMMEDGLNILKLAAEIGQIGNKNLVSDAVIAVILSMSTLDCAKINVRINLQSLKDINITKGLEEKMENIFKEAKIIKEKAFQEMNKKIPLE